MKHSILNSLLSALVIIGGITLPAYAQVNRSSESVYVRPHAGISYYMGDNEKSPFNFDGDMFDSFPYNAGIEVGYQFNPSYSLGLRVVTGAFTQITDFEVVTETADHPNTRWGVGLIARKLISDGRIAPYWQAGLSLGGGTSYVHSGGCAGNVAGACAEQDELSYGGHAGVGMDIFLNPGTSLFVESSIDIRTPDMASDGRDNNGFGALDFLGAHAVGARFNLKRTVPVELQDLVCPVDVVDAGTPVTFTASHNANVSAPVVFEWAFGDGSSAQGMTVTHAFDRAGDYTVDLRATNGKGAHESTRSCVVSVKDPCIPAAITAMRASNMNPDTQTSVAFSASVTGTDGTWRWDFGDGNTGSGANPSHTYAEAGTYTVTLEVENCAGVTRRTMTITVDPYEAAICRDITEMNVALFDRNTSTLNEEGRAALRENLAILVECPNMNVRLEGLASPGERAPQKLSEDRARVVEQFYIDGGVAASRMVTTGLGRSDQGSKKEGLAQFRRVLTIPVR